MNPYQKIFKDTFYFPWKLKDINPNLIHLFWKSQRKYGLLFLLLFQFSSVQAATDCTQVTEIPQAECETLVALYNSTNGPGWFDSATNNWNVTNTPCSDWAGISCSNGHVTNINKFQSNLVGTLPNLSALTQLQFLGLDSNQLSGTIPDLSALTQLQVISLWNNQLTGTIPDWSALTQLQGIDLYKNQLSGPIPDLSTLTQLQFIGLENNQLSGAIPDLGALTQLQILDLSGNQLSGPIPDLSALTSLQGLLYLHNNQLCGEIPSSLASLSKLSNNTLHIENNHLTTFDPILITFLNSKNPGWTKQTPCSEPPKVDCTATPHNPACPPPSTFTLEIIIQGVGKGTVSSKDKKINCTKIGGSCQVTYKTGTTVILTPSTESDSYFSNWEGEGCTDGKVDMSQARTCTANFHLLPELKVNIEGEGRVKLTQAGVATGTNCEKNCTQTYPPGTEVSLTATPSDGWQFSEWSGECRTTEPKMQITINAATDCTATFIGSPYTLTVNKSGNGSGQITSTPAGIDCGPTCSAQFSKGTTVKLKATSEPDSTFGGWWGDWWQGRECYGNNPLSVPMDKNITCEVNFIPGGGIPNINVWQTALNFEASSNTSKVTQMISIYSGDWWNWWNNNNLNAALQLDTLTVDNPAFVFKDTCSNIEIAPWYGCTLEVEFHPQSADPTTATLSIPSNDPDTPIVTVTLNGSVCPSNDSSQPSIFVYPSLLDFGTQPIGDSASLISSVYISTWGQTCGMPQIDTIQLTGSHASEFSFKDKQCYHGGWGDYAYSFCWGTLMFSPTSEGQKEAQLNITFNDPALEPSSIPIQAQATTGQAHLEISPQEIDFGSVSLERSNSEPLMIKNTGKVNLKLKDIHVSGDSFNIPDLWNCYGYYGWGGVPELPPDGQCQITAQFSPTEVGDQQGTLIVISNDPDSPTTQIPLNGKAVEPQDCSNAHITIESASSGPWGSGSTWNTGTPPTDTDVVRLKGGHTITGIAYAKVKTLCIEPQATLESPDDHGSPLWVQVTDYIQNKGIVRGKDGTNESNGAECTRKEMLGQGSCAYPGASISLMTGIQEPNNNGGWWWEGSGSPIRNEGKIRAGQGGNGSRYAAAGGEVTVLGRNTLNTLSGVIQGGGGGHLLGTLYGEAGHGGKTEVWGKLGGEGYLKNYGEMRGGNGGECNASASETQSGGNGGDLRLFSLPWIDLGGLQATGKGGTHCQPLGIDGQDGQLIIDPSVISLTGAHTRVEGGNVTIFGGKDWVLNLSNLDHPVVHATGDIVLAVGEGGAIDLRGNRQIVLEAQGQVMIFSNSILLEEGKRLNDVIAAKNIVVAPSKILRDVSLTASEKVMGSPATTVPVMVVLNNNGPEQDTYVLKVKDSKGWPLGQVPETMTVEGLSTVQMAFNVTLPTTRGEMNRIEITATSQADPQVSITKEVQAGVAMSDAEVMVPILPQATSSSPSPSEDNTISPIPPGESPTPSSPPEENIPSDPEESAILPSPPEETPLPPSHSEEDTTPPVSPPSGISFPKEVPSFPAPVETREVCPSTGMINMLCDNRNRVIKDATLGPRAILSGGKLAGTIHSRGFVSQVTIQSDTVLSGGTLSGYILNQGTLADITFVGAILQGGILAGTITNVSKVGGTLIDVTLAPKAHLQGGKLQGKIQGDKEAPALLENVKILKGSTLSGVTLGKGVVLEEGVTLE